MRTNEIGSTLSMFLTGDLCMIPSVLAVGRWESSNWCFVERLLGSSGVALQQRNGKTHLTQQIQAEQDLR